MFSYLFFLSLSHKTRNRRIKRACRVTTVLHEIYQFICVKGDGYTLARKRRKRFLQLEDEVRGGAGSPDKELQVSLPHAAGDWTQVFLSGLTFVVLMLHIVL